MTREPAWNELLLQSEQLIRQVRVDRCLTSICACAPSSTRRPCSHRSVFLLLPCLQQDQGLPLRIERDIRQVEQFSQRLRAKSIRPGGSDYLQDADRLLAQEGLDPALCVGSGEGSAWSAGWAGHHLCRSKGRSVNAPPATNLPSPVSLQAAPHDAEL